MKWVLILAAAAEAATGFAGGSSGILLWPAVVLHAALTALLAQSPTGNAEART